MTRWLRSILARLPGAPQPPQRPVDRSQLMGMYLSQANQPPDPAARGLPTRERQDGKFAQKRRRG
ncbi:MAG TPA: hypothetical protein VMU04_18495 [Candidatus Acidoferrum sp.]|nr:hypothetical protein [Candidatus Acidoferrum sp.]